MKKIKKKSKITKLKLYKNKIKRYLPLLSHLASDKKNEKLIVNTKKPVIKLIEDICQNCTKGALVKQFNRNIDLKKCCKSVHFISSYPGKKIKQKKKNIAKRKWVTVSIIRRGNSSSS
jgi:hypothetical protein